MTPCASLKCTGAETGSPLSFLRISKADCKKQKAPPFPIICRRKSRLAFLCSTQRTYRDRTDCVKKAGLFLFGQPCIFILHDIDYKEETHEKTACNPSVCCYTAVSCRLRHTGK